MYSRQDNDLTEEAIMLKKVPSNVSDNSDNNTSGMGGMAYKTYTCEFYLPIYNSYILL
jgi:hypothetical protein